MVYYLERGLIMHIQPISFGASFTVKQGKSSGIDADGMNKEVIVTDMARQIGVNVPTYNISLTYETKGEPASFPLNKIEEKHFASLFKNLFLMDKNNLNHNDLDIGHVFYSDDGSVEFDCFRFSSPFVENSQKKYSLPDFIMPTNQINYENASLSLYVAQIPDKEEKREFIKSYLKASRNYHKDKANLMIQNSRINYPSEMKLYELVQEWVFIKPDNKMADLMIQKLDFFAKQRQAFTEWDEGNGACGHTFSKERRLNAIPMYLDAVKSAIEYSIKARELSSKTNYSESKYYDYESKLGEYFANTYLSWIEGMSDWNFRDERVQPLNDDEREELSASYKKILEANLSEKPAQIDEYLKLYNSKI